MKTDKIPTTRNREGERGAALVMALLISFLLLVASAGLLLETSMNAANVTDAVSEQEAYHAAESGIQSAVHVLRCQKNTNPGCADVTALPLYPSTTSTTDPKNQVNYTKAANPADSNASGTGTTATLSRWIRYDQTCDISIGVPCVGLNRQMPVDSPYAYSLVIRDPDNTGSFVSVSMSGRLYDNDSAIGGSSLSKTYGSGTNTLTVSYTPPSAVTNYDMGSGNLTTQFGVFNINRGASGGAVVPADSRFEIHVHMTRPYDAVATVRGWILKTSLATDIPKIIFDSQTITLVGSEVTLNLNNAPSSGWSSFQVVPPPNPPVPNARIGYQGQPSVGTNVIGGSISKPEPTRLEVISTGYGPRGAKKELHAIIQKNFFNGLTAPAALTLVGPHRTGAGGTPVDNPADPESHFFFSLGQSAVLQYSGVDMANPRDIIPPIGTSNPVSLDCVEDYILQVAPTPTSQCRDSFPNGSNPFNGNIQGSPSDVSTDMPFWLQTPQALDVQIHQLAATARSSGRFFTAGQTPTTWGSVATGTGITFVDGDVTLGHDQGDGGGILVVTGTLTLKGSFNYNGLIIVTGPGGIQRSGGGNAAITGNVVVAPYVNNKIVDRTIAGPPVQKIDDPAGIFLAPHYNMDGGGGSNLQFNSASLQSGLTAISNFVLGVVEK
jgi:Tfp pilus assembly protein PilX